MRLEERIEVWTPEEFSGDSFVLVYKEPSGVPDVMHAEGVDPRDRRDRFIYGEQLRRKQREPVAYLRRASVELYRELLHYRDILTDYESVRDVVDRVSSKE